MSEAAPQTGTAGRASVAAELYAASGAAALGLSEPEFTEALASAGARYLPAGAGEQAQAEFYRSLRVEELALARACAAGREKAWEIFLTRFREKLYDAARGIVGDDSRAKELADSLYADLYGLRERDGRRVSKLQSYTGRGSLEGWLRTVLAQEYINRFRSGKRLVSLEEQVEAGAQFSAKQDDPPPAADSTLEQATDEALGALAAEDRYILSAYYLDGLTQADIGRTLGVHESTISRKVERIAKGLREAIAEGLKRRGMSERQAAEALESDVRDLRVEVRAKLAQETRGSPFLKKGEKSNADPHG